MTPGPTSALASGLAFSLLSRIEDAGLNASAPPQQRWVDGWLVRFSPGKAKRARCVNAVADGRLPIAERLAACEAVFAEVGLPLIVRITPFTRPAELDAQLESRGLRSFDDTRVMVLGELGRLAARPIAHGITITAIGAHAFARRVGDFRGSPLAQQQAQAERLINSPVPFSPYELREDGETVACGQFARQGELVGLYDVFTAPAARGRGLAGVLCRHLLVEAQAQGARHAYLQVEGDNHAARAVYHRLGFTDGYAYHYRTRDPSAA